MANSITDNPWRFDTANAGDVITGRVHPKTVRWVGVTTAGHRCVIKDSNDVIVWEDIANGANYVTESRIEIPWDGMRLPTLDSGVLYIEHL